MSLKTTIRIVYISGGFPLWALYVANEKGFFKNAVLLVSLSSQQHQMPK